MRVNFLCSKAYNTLHSCHDFPAGSWQATRGARISLSSLLGAGNKFNLNLKQDITIFTDENEFAILCVMIPFLQRSMNCGTPITGQL